MQQIRAGSASAWNEQFIAQLEFIKKHLRFPFKGLPIWKSVFFLAIIPGICILVYALLFFRFDSNNSVYAILMLAIVTNLYVLRRFYLTLRFRPVPALPQTIQNISLIKNFLQSNHFAFQQHPEAAEVFQIISRNINASGEDREVLVFIADEGRILLNSHFAQSGNRVTMGTQHVKEMAKDLKQFLSQQTELSS